MTETPASKERRADALEQATRRGARNEFAVFCPDCGLCQSVIIESRATTALCLRCGRVLRKNGHGRSNPIVCTSACVALALLVVGYSLPLMSVEAGSRYTEATLTSGPEILLRRGEWEIAGVLTITLLIAPIAHAVLLIAAGCGWPSAAQTQYWRAKVLDAIAIVSRWSMLEIFLIGVIVAWTRLSQWLAVNPTPALLALLAATLAMQVASRALLPQRLAEEVPAMMGYGREKPCPTQNVASGKPSSGSRAWLGLTRCGALTLAGIFLYVPANLLPIITIRRITEGGPTTIMSGVEELLRDGAWLLAAVVFIASVAVPLLKLFVLAALIVMTLRQSPRALRARTRLYRLIAGIGRWSMLDIFVLSLLVSLVRLGVLGYVAPEPGALAFCAVVVITMVATEIFDPKLMWEAAAMKPSPLVPSQRGERV